MEMGLGHRRACGYSTVSTKDVLENVQDKSG